MSAVLEATGIDKRFGHRDILRDIDLDLAPGRITALFGPNGAGKSTLLKILALLVRPTAGAVRFEGRPVADEAGARFRRHLGLVGHRTFLYDHLTAEENLHFYGRLYGVADLNRRIGTLLDRVGLTFAARDTVGSYSRGMQQRLAIARALLPEPRVLLMDEPFTGLDQSGQRLLMDLLREFRAGGGACLLISHDFAESLALADEFVILARGRVVRRDPVAGITAEAFARDFDAAVAGEG